MELRDDHRRNDIGCGCGATPGSATEARSSEWHDLGDVRRQLSKYSGDGRHIHSTCRFDGHFGVHRDLLPQHARARGDRHRCGNRGWDDVDPRRATQPRRFLYVRRAERDSRRLLNGIDVQLSTVYGLSRPPRGPDRDFRSSDDGRDELVGDYHVDPRRGQRTVSGSSGLLRDVRDFRNGLSDVPDPVFQHQQTGGGRVDDDKRR